MEVQWSSYPKFLFYDRINMFIFPVALCLFVGFEIFISLLLLLYSRYDTVRDGTDPSFESFQTFWMAMGLLHVGCFVMTVSKVFLMELVVLKSNEEIHEDMIMGIVRSPFSYFDVTPSGHLTNNFSNDLGILDNAVAENFTQIIERTILWVVMSASIMKLNSIYLVSVACCLAFFVFISWYCQAAIISVKQLNLQLKSPIFTHLSEIMRGLVPIQALQQTERFTQKMIELLDTSLRGTVCMTMVERFFAFSIQSVTVLLLIIGMELAVGNLNENNSIQFGVQILFIFRMIQAIQLLIKQIITCQTYMINFERVNAIIQLQP